LTARFQLGGAALAAALAAVLAALPARGQTPAPAATAQHADNKREPSLADYRQHLVELNAVVEACAKARDTKTCAPSLVGQDDRVPLGNPPNAERRLVRYDWLRVLLEKAQSKDEVKSETQNKGESQNKAEPQNKVEIPTKGESQDKGESQNKDKPPATPQVKPVIGAEPAPVEAPTLPLNPTTSELLQAAETRLTQDLAQVDGMATGAPAADHSPERATLKQVLAGRDFRHLEAPTARDSALEKLGAWLNQFFESLGKLQAGAAWVGRAIVWGFYLAVCVGLVWGLMQMERRWRIRLTPESDRPAAGAASARDWQLYLQDARRAAAAGQWRLGVHFVYWAAISRLESRRLWPADRARTPREYLALVAPEDPRRAGLARLTGSFERVWYGGRAAEESDYRKAEELAGALTSGSGASAVPTEGGAR
jgi:hypothetical protein